MARKADEMMDYLMIGVVVFGGYTFGRQGKLGSTIKDLADQIHCMLSPSSADCAGGGTKPPAGGCNPGYHLSNGVCVKDTAPPGGCNTAFIPGKRYVDYNANLGGYMVVMCGNWSGPFRTQAEAEAYYNQVVCLPQNQSC